jgi:UDP-2,3-diacylglucosamine pyrophosphatase LpxH
MQNKDKIKTSKVAEVLAAEAKESYDKSIRNKNIATIAELFEKRGIDPAEVGDLKKVSFYQAVTKDSDGDYVIHDLTAVQFVPSWDNGPKWPVVTQGPCYSTPKPTTKVRKATTFRTAIIVPDIQIGFYRGADGNLEPTHDEAAMSVALSMISDVNPDEIVLVGDNLDLPEMSKYLTYPTFQQTTQASIDRASLFCAQLRKAAPSAEITWLAGNHEERMPKYIATNAMAAYGLKRANAPESWPVLSVPFLVRMEEYGITYKPGYPAADYWLNEKLRVIHGDRVRSNGSTAHVYLNQEKTSVIYGHIHRIEMAYKTREDYDGPRTIMAASPGCLARIDGALPSTKGGVDLDGRPLTRHENWQQGLGVVTYEKAGTAKFFYESIPIYGGWAMRGGKEYAA